MTTTNQRDCLCGHAYHEDGCLAPRCRCESYQPRNGIAAPRPPTPAVAGAPTLEQLLATADRSGAKRVVGLAAKIRAQFDDLRARLAEERRAAEQRQRVEQEQAAARQRIADLEAQLRQARATLRGTTETPPSSSHACPHADCGRTFTTKQGLSSHLTRSHGGKGR